MRVWQLQNPERTVADSSRLPADFPLLRLNKCTTWMVMELNVSLFRQKAKGRHTKYWHCLVSYCLLHVKVFSKTSFVQVIFIACSRCLIYLLLCILDFIACKKVFNNCSSYMKTFYVREFNQIIKMTYQWKSTGKAPADGMEPVVVGRRFFQHLHRPAWKSGHERTACPHAPECLKQTQKIFINKTCSCPLSCVTKVSLSMYIDITGLSRCIILYYSIFS